MIPKQGQISWGAGGFTFLKFSSSTPEKFENGMLILYVIINVNFIERNFSEKAKL